jgi:Spy/CpxP family protein refolding chaperone
MRNRLGLTPDQINRLQTQAEVAERARIQRRADIEIRQREFDDLMRAAQNPDRTTLDRKLQELNAARLSEEKAALEERFTAEGVLTPEQKQKLQQFRQEAPEGMMRRMPRKGPDGPRNPAPPAAKPPNEK